MQRADVLGIGEAGRDAGLAFDEECKLVYGVLLSLRNMVKKLSGRSVFLLFFLDPGPFSSQNHTYHRGGQFQSYRTSAYKFHFYETLTGYKFILLSDPLADNMQFVLKAIYSGPFLDFVVRNDLVGVRGGGLDESWGIPAEKGKIRGRGIDNDRVSDSLSSVWPVKLKYVVRPKVPHSRGSPREGSHQLWSMIAASEVACRSSVMKGLCNDLRHHLVRTVKCLCM
jgi:hypothetical protein